MNWLIREKMFIYFYNKFSPVNRMHCLKCGVHLSHNSGWCIRSVASWITVLSRHIVFTKRVIYYKFTFMWYSAKAPCTGPCRIWCTVCPFFGREKNTDGSAVGLMISLASVCYDFCWSLLLLLLFLFLFFFLKIIFKIANLCTWFRVGVSNQNFTDGFLLKFYFFSQPWLWDNRLPCLHYVWLARVAETLYL